MLAFRRAPLLATAAFAATAALAGCMSVTPAATPPATVGAPTAAATAAATQQPSAALTPAPTTTAAPTATPVASVPASTEPSAGASSEPTSGAVTTPVPGSSIDVTQSDAGIVGRLTIEDDTRPQRIGTDDHTGTSEIIGRADDGSSCDFGFGDDFNAVAWYNDAPNGMLHQMSISVPVDEMPANDGEQRAGITDARMYADFVSESGFGTAYSGDSTEADNGGSSKMDISFDAGTLTFTFTGTTWDDIAFSGQLICSGVDLGG